MKTKVAPIVVLGGALVGFVLLLSIIRSISFHSLSRPSCLFFLFCLLDKKRKDLIHFWIDFQQIISLET